MTSRDVATQNILGAISVEGLARRDAGAMAAAGMSEAGYGLPAEQVKALAEAMSPRNASSQCSRILSTALRQSAKRLVEKRCGDFAALEAKIANAPPERGTDQMIAACRLPAMDEKAMKSSNPWAVLTSAIVVDELSAQPQSTDDEKKVARALVDLCSHAAR